MVINEARVARDVVVIAASAGGLVPLLTLAGALEATLPAGLVAVLHRNPSADGQLLPVVQRRSHLPVVEPRDGDALLGGTLFLAPRDQHLLLDGGVFRLNRGPKLHYTRPAADALFCSAAATYGPRVLGVVLSGGGFDGARGAIAIKAAGGLMLTQAPGEAEFPFMPKHTLQLDHVDAALSLPQLAAAIRALATGEPYEA
jgi:two-component system chemotaxis response regulator CheB